MAEAHDEALERTPAAVFGPFEDAPRKPRRDDVFECAVSELDERGAGRGRVGAYGVRLRGTLPGATVLAQVTKRRGNRLDARVLATLAPSPDAVPARCRHFADCGGCSFQDLAYPRQLEEQRRLVERALAPVADRLPGPVPTPIGCEPPWRYRNKLDFTVGARRWIERDDDGRPTDLALGLHAAGRHDKVLDVLACEIAFEGAAEVLGTLRRLAREHGLAPYDNATHAGFLRHAVLRRGVATGETLLDLVTSAADAPGWRAAVEGLLEAHPELTTVVQHATTRLSEVAVGEPVAVWKGDGFFHDELGGVRFRLSAHSFFQTNTRQAERLVALAREWASADGVGGVLWDLYCGAGAFALTLADRFETVVGVELVEAAVRDAAANAERNGVANARFHAGDAAALLAAPADGGADLPRPDAAVVDPPRAGLHAKVADALVAAGPPRVLYVSCNPAAAARDLARLTDGGYAIARLQPVDLFPHTPHVECLFELERESEREPA